MFNWCNGHTALGFCLRQGHYHELGLLNSTRSRWKEVFVDRGRMHMHLGFAVQYRALSGPNGYFMSVKWIHSQIPLYMGVLKKAPVGMFQVRLCIFHVNIVKLSCETIPKWQFHMIGVRFPPKNLIKHLVCSGGFLHLCNSAELMLPFRLLPHWNTMPEPPSTISPRVHIQSYTIKQWANQFHCTSPKSWALIKQGAATSIF